MADTVDQNDPDFLRILEDIKNEGEKYSQSCSAKSEDNKNKKKPQKQQRRRPRFTRQQRQELEAVFASNRNPELKVRKEIAQRLNLMEVQVTVWLKNRRARWQRDRHGMRVGMPRYLTGNQGAQLNHLANHSNGLNFGYSSYNNWNGVPPFGWGFNGVNMNPLMSQQPTAMSSSYCVQTPTQSMGGSAYQMANSMSSSLGSTVAPYQYPAPTPYVYGDQTSSKSPSINSLRPAHQFSHTPAERQIRGLHQPQITMPSSAPMQHPLGSYRA